MRSLLVALLLLGCTLPGLGFESGDRWVEVKSQHFSVMADTSEKEARHVAAQFERMRAVFQVLMPSVSDTAGSPIVVLALKDRKAFQALEPEAYLAKGQLNLAGYFMRTPDKNYILLRTDAEGDHPFATVYHEYTHYMMRGASEWIPLWLNEGLAEFYQNSDIQEKEVLIGQPSSADVLYLRQKQLLPLATLLKVDQGSPYYHEEEKGSVFYAESWALTHYLEMNDRQKGTHRIEDYARLLIKKVDPITAAQQAFGDLKQLQGELSNYIARNAFMEFKMKSPVGFDEASMAARPLPTPEANAVRADVMANSGRTKEAEVLLEATLRDNPESALAHETMGYLRFREKDLPSAKKWYGEAVKLDSQSYLAHYYYATITMSQEGDRAGQDPEILQSLATSIKLNPGFAPAYDALAMYEARDAARVHEAHMHNLSAVGLAPDNLGYRMNTAAVLMRGNEYGNALKVLKEARHVAKTPEEVAMVEERERQIEEHQAAVARQKEAESGEDASVTATATDARTTTTDTRTMTLTSTDDRAFVIRPHAVDELPQYPTEDPVGPRHTTSGRLSGVKCAYPKILVLTLEPAGRAAPVKLYQNDFYKIEFTVANFTPKGDINPCTDIEGLKGKVEYAEVRINPSAGRYWQSS